jgi:23S rRNA (adenine2503-C2)-methyltransferase
MRCSLTPGTTPILPAAGCPLRLLAKRLRKHLGQLVHVNVIPLNPTPGSKWDASPKPVEREFVRLVNAGGVACTVRDTRGQEIAAACGQLAAEG